MPLETGCRQGARHERGDGAGQIDIAGGVRAQSVQLHRRTADQHRGRAF
jgi:hypothetical protein